MSSFAAWTKELWALVGGLGVGCGAVLYKFLASFPFYPVNSHLLDQCNGKSFDFFLRNVTLRDELPAYHTDRLYAWLARDQLGAK